MSVRYQSTRGGETGLSFEHVLLSAYANDGGMFVPEQLPAIPKTELLTWAKLDFPDVRERGREREREKLAYADMLWVRRIGVDPNTVRFLQCLGMS